MSHIEERSSLGGTLAQLRAEGLERSQALRLASWLTDVYGPRPTGSESFEQSAQWAARELGSFGLKNVRLEHWPYGRGWSLRGFHAELLEPQVQPLIGYPAICSPSVHVRSAKVVLIPLNDNVDPAEFAGTLSGKIVLVKSKRRVPLLELPAVLRMTPALFSEAETVLTPHTAAKPQPQLTAAIEEFYANEGVLALFDRGSDDVVVSGGSELSWRTQRTDGGTVFVSTGGPCEGANARLLPSVTIAIEQFNRMVRVLEKGLGVEVGLALQTRLDEAREGANVLAEIPGTELPHEVVMLGAHLDSVHVGTGATDNGAGVAAMMEAMRILMAVRARPRRTIRLGLWGGEEQGRLGSRHYVEKHFGVSNARPTTTTRETLSVYFNIDDGAGRIRGIWLQENTAAASTFRQWMRPLADLGVTACGLRSVYGTDHISFDETGIPGFAFMQDRLEYKSRSHHSNMDVFDRLQARDLEQMAVVAASIAYMAAMSDSLVPRKTTARGKVTRP